MPLTLQTVPEAATWLQLLLVATSAAALAWLVLLLFVHWRRSATNLTPVTAPSVNRGAQPDFLGVDRKARRAALERADEFAEKLGARERREAAAQQAKRRSKRAARIASLASLFMSVFSLLTLVAGAVWQVTWIGTVWHRYSAGERILAVMRAHPVAFAVCSLVITYHVVSFFVDRKWRSEG